MSAWTKVDTLSEWYWRVAWLAYLNYLFYCTSVTNSVKSYSIIWNANYWVKIFAKYVEILTLFSFSLLRALLLFAWINSLHHSHSIQLSAIHLLRKEIQRKRMLDRLVVASKTCCSIKAGSETLLARTATWATMSF